MYKVVSVIILFFYLCASCIAQEAYTKVINWKKTSDNKLLIEYNIINSKNTETYNIKVHLFEKNIELTLFNLSGDIFNVKGSDIKRIYWDVLKDRQVFPRLMDISHVSLEIQSQVDRIGNTQLQKTNQHSVSDDIYLKLNNSKAYISKNEAYQSHFERMASNKVYSISLFGYDYDCYDKTYRFDFFRLGFFGFVFTPLTLNTIKNENGNIKETTSLFTKMEFKTGGPIFKGLNLSIVGIANLSSNSKSAVDGNDKNNNVDIYTKKSLFGGIELSTNFSPKFGSLANFYVRTGFNYSTLTSQYVLSDYSYSDEYLLGPTTYFTVTLGAKILDLKNDILYLW